jgi:phosphopantothenoylcysteine decarboxylase/phosphopantothenate--cysteine ligase
VIELEKTKDILASRKIKKISFNWFCFRNEMKLKMPKVKSRKKLRFDCFKFQDQQVLKPTNKVPFIDKNFNIEPMELKSKEAVADDI